MLYKTNYEEYKITIITRNKGELVLYLDFRSPFKFFTYYINLGELKSLISFFFPLNSFYLLLFLLASDVEKVFN